MGRLPLGEETLVLDVALRRAVLAEQDRLVLAAAERPVHDGLTGLLVEAVRGRCALAPTRHTVFPRNSEDFRITPGFEPHSRPSRGTPNLRPELVFCQSGRPG